jgi:glutathione S-transferase
MAQAARRTTARKPAASAEPAAVLRISSRNYSSWSLRGWLLCRMAGLPVQVEVVSPDDPGSRAELLLQSSSILLPSLLHKGAELWDTLAIAEYLNEEFPAARMMPEDRIARARCRATSGEMHAGFAALRSTLPQNLRAHVPGFPLWSGARADIARIGKIWDDCLREWGGPWLFGARRSVADAMYAPVVCRLETYDVKLEGRLADYCATTLAEPDLREWIAAALEEKEAQIAELDLEAEF